MQTLRTPKGKLNIGALNCQGLKGKFDDPELQNVITTDDIFGVSETKSHLQGINSTPITGKRGRELPEVV